jgi:hypothetical protein
VFFTILDSTDLDDLCGHSFRCVLGAARYQFFFLLAYCLAEIPFGTKHSVARKIDA